MFFQLVNIFGSPKFALKKTNVQASIDVGLDQPTRWCLLLYPNGNQEDREGFVSLYLYRYTLGQGGVRILLPLQVYSRTGRGSDPSTSTGIL